jgi:Predicted AAA-ATPase/PD-(D/E)XK nuclease superfamily
MLPGARADDMTTPRLRFPIGTSDFRALRKDGFRYVDKTALVDAVLDASAQVLLVPRPRRFGKTLNLSMLRYFFEKSPEDRGPLFAGLAVASSEAARPHFQRYPVIFLSLKDVRPSTWDECFLRIADVLSDLYGEHRYLLTEGNLALEDAEVFTAILGQRASEAACGGALRRLSRLLAQHHGERVVILLDEYDTPIHAGFTRGYYDEVIAFFRDFLSAGLKDNPHLWKGMLTGILRVAKESLFSGLNNVVVYDLLRAELAPFFGFTEPEVKDLVQATGRPDLLGDIRAFYNGYLFGHEAIYNPWSVLCFLDNVDKELLPYWIDTSSNDLVSELLFTGSGGVAGELEVLLEGGTVEKTLEESIVLRDVTRDSNAVWSFLLFTGYLKPVELRTVDGRRLARLGVPNAEVAIALRRMAERWMEAQVGDANALEALLRALLRGEGPVIEKHLSHMVRLNLSYFDLGGPEPERFYHGLVVGLLVGLGPRYEVRSNRESGLGRCDVMVLPKSAGQPGVVMELKRVDTEAGETVEKAAAAALKQLRDRDYAAELRARGASPIHEVAAVFDGKRAHVRVAGAG